MSASYVVKKLQELSQAIDSISDEELKNLAKDKDITDSNMYDFLCETVLNQKNMSLNTANSDNNVLDISSPEFLRQT